MTSGSTVFLDARLYGHSGIGRYIDELYGSILEDDPGLRVVAAGDVGALRGSIFGRQEMVSYPAPIYSITEQVSGSILAMRYAKRADVLHFPHYNAPWVFPRRSVVTVHDVTHLLFPDLFGRVRSRLAKRVLGNTLSRAARIIAVSDNTRRDLVKQFPEVEEKVVVIHNGISSCWHPIECEPLAAFKKQTGLAEYVLYVGNRKPHKNIARMLAAFSILRNRHASLRLVVAGARFAETDDVDVWRRSNPAARDAVVEVEGPSDEELRAYYCGARALIQPSLYEGFGFPALEAMACGTPVVGSNSSSLPEVCGDAALLFDPHDVADIAAQLSVVLEHEDRSQEMIEAGRERAKMFSWRQCADKTLAVFSEVKSL